MLLSNAISGLILGVAGKDTIHKDAIARQLYHHFQCRCTNTSVTTFFFAKFKQDSCLRGAARGGAEGALAPSAPPLATPLRPALPKVLKYQMVKTQT